MDKESRIILVVDDDADILRILRDNLELDGYRVLTAGTGTEALTLFREKSPDLLVLDLMLPDMDGVQVCRVLRAQSAVPIVMLTAKDGVSDKVLGLESGADDYLVKPFNYLELAARIRACLRRARPGGAAERPLGETGIEMNPEDRSVKVNGRTVVLTGKEFEILGLLVQNAGRALSRERIQEALWPEGKLYRWSRTIDVHVQHLRAKLEADPEHPALILTVPGVGYRWAGGAKVPESG